MATPPTLIGFAQVAGTTATVTTASLSWQTGDVIVVLAVNEGATSGATFTTPTTTGSGLTFTQQQNHTSASNCAAGGWTAVASATSSGTFTIGGISAGPNRTGGAFVWRGSAGVGNSVQAASATRTVNLTPVGADGAICWVVGDWAAATAVTASPTPTTHSSASPGPTALPIGTQVGTNYTYYFDDLDDQTSAGAVGYGVTGAGTGPFTIIVIEVKAAAGAAATIPDIFMGPMGG
jgi:hypothetical protein